MHAVVNEAGEKITNAKKVLQEQQKFYQQLYSKDKTVESKWNLIPTKTISNEVKENYDQTITIEELGKALSQTKRFKSPGPDGIPADFYKVFFCKIKTMLIEAFRFALDEGLIHPSAREGIISLIPKKSGNSTKLAQWRPIILLCADYKLLAKIITNRIKDSLKRHNFGRSKWFRTR